MVSSPPSDAPLMPALSVNQQRGFRPALGVRGTGQSLGEPTHCSSTGAMAAPAPGGTGRATQSTPLLRSSRPQLQPLLGTPNLAPVG